MDENKEINSFKCPSCGGPLDFDPEAARFSCPFCDGKFDLDTVKNADVNRDEKDFSWGEYKESAGEDVVEGTASYVCTSCGAEIVTDAVTAATRCPYCDNAVIVGEHLSGLIKPNAIIPFKIGKKELTELLHNFAKGKFLLPKTYFSESRINETLGIYVPFWLFDCKSHAKSRYNATRVTSWSDSKYHYTKTDYYNVHIEGEAGFSRIPVDGSVKMDDMLMDSLEPYDYSGLCEFAKGYLSGFSADRFDVDADKSFPRAETRVEQTFDDEFRRKLSYDTLTKVGSNVKIDSRDVKYVLLPVYLISASFRGKLYQFAVNGQTGKVVGELPIAWGKFWGLLLGVAGAISAILILLMYLL